MFCPSCESELRLQEIYMNDGDLIVLNLCDRCAGFWIENYNMQKIFNMKQFPADKIPTFYPVEGLQVIEEGKRYCPLCGNKLDMLVKKGFNVELCRDCNGLWLDMDKLKALYYLKKRHQKKEENNNNSKETDINSLNLAKYTPRRTPFACYHDESNEAIVRRELQKREEFEVMPDYNRQRDEKMYDNVSNVCDFITDVFIDPYNRYGIERNRPQNKRNNGGLLGNLYDFIKPNDYD